MTQEQLLRKELERAGLVLVDMGAFLINCHRVPLDDIAEGVEIMKEHVDGIYDIMQFVRSGLMSRVVEEIIQKAKEHKA